MSAPESARSAFLAAEAEVERLHRLYAVDPTRELMEQTIKAQRHRNACRERLQQAGESQ